MTSKKSAQSRSQMPNPLDLRLFATLPKRGQFFSLSRNFNPAEITTVFTELKAMVIGPTPPLGQADWHCHFQHTGSGNGKWNTTVSAFAVVFDHVPSFLASPAPIERRCGYVVLVEIELLKGAQHPRYLFVQRLHLDNPCTVIDLQFNPPACDELRLETFLEPFTNQASRFESISMRPMGMSKTDIRRKVIEAYDVQIAVSSLGLNRVVAGSLRVVQPAGAATYRRLSLSPRLRKLQQAGEKLSLTDLADWAASIASELDEANTKATLSSSFLRSFAAPAPSLKGEAAQSVLVDVPVLRELIDGFAYRIVDISKQAATQPRSEAVGNGLLEAMDNAIVLTADNQVAGKFVGVVPGYTKAKIVIKVMSRTCTLTLENCDWGVQALPSSSNTQPETVRLDRFINEKKAFRVLLKNGAMMFSAEGAFEDAEIRRSAKLLLNIMRPVAPELEQVITEKGVPTAKATAFQQTSSFHVIEAVISASHDWLLLDDGGTEWCDYMSLADAGATTAPEVRWYHAKVKRVKDRANGADLPMNSSDGSRSASGLQEVVGQAVKNLGRIRMNSKNEDVKKRRKEWGKIYQWPDKSKVSSSMQRLRRAPQAHAGSSATSQVTAFLDAYDLATANPHTIFEVALVVPNYQKATLEQSFNKLGTKKGTQTAAQMFWLLSGFMHSCLEVGVRPVIYCR